MNAFISLRSHFKFLYGYNQNNLISGREMVRFKICLCCIASYSEITLMNQSSLGTCHNMRARFLDLMGAQISMVYVQRVSVLFKSF